MWRPDPESRHELRYHDGQQWTEHVSDRGTGSIDPIETSPSVRAAHDHGPGGWTPAIGSSSALWGNRAWQPEAPRTGVSGAKVVAITIACSLAALLLGIGIGVAGTSDKTGVTAIGDTSTSVATSSLPVVPTFATTVLTTAAPNTPPPPTQPPTAAATKPKTYQQAFAAQGEREKRTETFALTSSTSRLVYSAGDGGTAIYVLEEGRSLEKGGGSPEVSCLGVCKDQTQLAKPPGRYYVEVNSTTTWSLAIEELR